MRHVAFLLAALLLAGCAVEGDAPQSTPTPVPSPVGPTGVTGTPTSPGAQEATPTGVSPTTDASAEPTPEPVATATPASPSPTPVTATQPTTPPEDAPPETRDVAISGFAFQPAQVSVPVGTRVNWTNVDGAAHTVTAEDGSFDSGRLVEWGTFGHVFDEPGTYEYRCAYHSSMRGSVTVTA